MVSNKQHNWQLVFSHWVLKMFPSNMPSNMNTVFSGRVEELLRIYTMWINHYDATFLYHKYPSLTNAEKLFLFQKASTCPFPAHPHKVLDRTNRLWNFKKLQRECPELHSSFYVDETATCLHIVLFYVWALMFQLVSCSFTLRYLVNFVVDRSQRIKVIHNKIKQQRSWLIFTTC